jgi:hypothetical protein
MRFRSKVPVNVPVRVPVFANHSPIVRKFPKGSSEQGSTGKVYEK